MKISTCELQQASVGTIIVRRQCCTAQQPSSAEVPHRAAQDLKSQTTTVQMRPSKCETEPRTLMRNRLHGIQYRSYQRSTALTACHGDTSCPYLQDSVHFHIKKKVPSPVVLYSSKSSKRPIGCGGRASASAAKIPNLRLGSQTLDPSFQQPASRGTVSWNFRKSTVLTSRTASSRASPGFRGVTAGVSRAGCRTTSCTKHLKLLQSGEDA